MIRRELPVSVDIGSKKYEIDADFRTIMNIEGIIFGKEVTEDQKNFAKEMMQEVEINEKDAITNAKYYDALKIFYKDNIPDDLEEAMEKMLWFYSCGKEETSKTKTKKKVISFEHDFDYINAGFMQDYKIDLFEVDFLHWWKFMSLFSEHHSYVKNIVCPTLIIHGTKDEIVPDTSVNYVYDNIKSTSVTLVEINGLTHDLFINDRYTDVKKLIFDFFKHKPKNTKNKYKI